MSSDLGRILHDELYVGVECEVCPEGDGPFSKPRAISFARKHARVTGHIVSLHILHYQHVYPNVGPRSLVRDR